MTDFELSAVDTTEPPSTGELGDDAAGDAGPSDPDASAGGGGSRRERRQRRKGGGSSAKRVAIEWAILIASALVIALVIKTFLFQAFYIPSQSMYPTLQEGDRILVNKLSYKVHDVNRGDIVVFETPKGEDSDIKDLVKRVVALPGETIETHSGRVYINGRLLEEPYLQAGVDTCAPNTAPPNCEDFGPVTVGKDRVFVMGDNREQSKDGRFFEAPNDAGIKESTIVGRVFVRIWPITDIGFL
jgi:signal peptidase I